MNQGTETKPETKAEVRQKKRSKKAKALKDRVIKAVNRIFPVMEDQGFDDWKGNRLFECMPLAYKDDKGWHVGKEIDVHVQFKAKLDSHGNVARQLHCELRDFITDLIRATDAIEVLCDRQDRKAESKKNGSASECEPAGIEDVEESSTAAAPSTSLGPVNDSPPPACESSECLIEAKEAEALKERIERRNSGYAVALTDAGSVVAVVGRDLSFKQAKRQRKLLKRSMLSVSILVPGHGAIKAEALDG